MWRRTGLEENDPYLNLLEEEEIMGDSGGKGNMIELEDDTHSVKEVNAIGH